MTTTDPAPEATSDWTALVAEEEQAEPDFTAEQPPAPRSIDTRLAEEYARLRRVEKARSDESKAAKAAADQIETQLLDQLLDANVRQLVVGDTLIHMHTTLKASKRGEVDREAFHAALREVGLGEFIKPAVSTQTLEAYVRDLRDADKPVPGPLAEVINVIEITKLYSKKAAERGTRTRSRR